MNEMIQSFMGLRDISDQMIASDFLIATKTSIKCYAVAISETSTPEVKKVLQTHLDDAINLHQKVTMYMIERGYYQPMDIAEQIKINGKAASTVLKIVGK